MILVEFPLAKIEEEIRRIEELYPYAPEIEGYAIGAIATLRWLIERSNLSPSEAVRISNY